MDGTTELSEYERQRQENIRKNQELLRQLQLTRDVLTPVRPSPSRTSSHSKEKSVVQKKRKIEEEPTPRRMSSRIRGIKADISEAGLRNEIENEMARRLEEEKKARERIQGDIKVGGSFFNRDGKIVTMFTDEDVKNTTDKSLKSIREKMMGLKIQEICGQVQVRVTPERVYTMAFHPMVDKQLIFAGDKVGNMGILDPSSSIKDEDGDELPNVTQAKWHSGAISGMVFNSTGQNLFTCSNDGTIRNYDLEKSVASPVFEPEDKNMVLTSLDILSDNVLYFSTQGGQIGRRDLRTKKTDIWQVTDKKIGNISSHPLNRSLIATASLDRTFAIWDLRKLKWEGLKSSPTQVGWGANRLSVSSANWNSKGDIATSSYDDTVRIYKFPESHGWKPGHTEESEDGFTADHIIKHNNQTECSNR